MENLAQKVEEALNVVNKQHFKTLEHAAEISPFVHSRSIGVETHTKGAMDDKPKVDKNVIGENNCPLLEKISINGPYHDVNSLQNLDYETISCSVLLRETEESRKRSIRQQIVAKQNRQIELMQENIRPIELQSLEEKKKWLQKKQQNDSLILQRAEKQSALELKEHSRQLEALRLQTQRQLQLISIQGISHYQQKFRSKYEVIMNLLMSVDKSCLASCNEYNKKFKELIQMFEDLIIKIKGGDCGPTEMRNAESLCKSLEELEMHILEALKTEKEKQEQEVKERQRQKEAEAVARQKAEKTELEAKKNATEQETTSVQTVCSSTPAGGDSVDQGVSSLFVSSERLEFYTKINSFYLEKVERVKVLQSDETMKKYRFDCQKNINIPVNAISAVSQQHIQDKFDKLLSFVTSQPALGRDYCILLMAKKFVGQGETTISSNPQAAFPVASVIVSLWKHIPEFGQLFLAYCFKECPFLVPYFIPQKKGQSIEEYSKVLGYRMSDGQLEKQDMYLKRHAGIARLYAAVMITNGRQQDGPLQPYGLEHAWRWLTNILALAPLPDMSATLIMEVLQIVGSDLWSAYGRQFVKLLIFIQQHYFPKLASVDAGGPKARLELLLSKFLREGQIQKPAGILPSGFW